MKDITAIKASVISARITQLEHETRIEAGQIEQAMTRLAMKRGAIAELKQLLAPAPEKPQEIVKTKAPVRARRTR